MQQYFPCPTCGAHNIIGAAACSHCRQQLFYNCPQCGAWVDNRYPHCPHCRRALNWPGTSVPEYAYGHTWYRPQGNYGQETKRSPVPAILVSLFIIGILALVFINPGSSSATKADSTASNMNAVLTAKTSASPSGSQAQITASTTGPALSSAPASTQVVVTDSSAYLPAGVTLSTTSGEIIEIDMTPSLPTSASVSGTSGSSTVKRSAYLQQLWPNWGRCTKGSCQSYTQQ